MTSHIKPHSNLHWVGSRPALTKDGLGPVTVGEERSRAVLSADVAAAGVMNGRPGVRAGGMVSCYRAKVYDCLVYHAL
jgi:hypothetical protein